MDLLGLIELKKYITGIQCAWIKRTTQHWCDMWRYDIKRKSFGVPINVNGDSFSAQESPILHNVCSSFNNFKIEFFNKDRNYMKANIFNNPLFTRGRNDNGLLNENFFGLDKSFEFFAKISKIKFEDFFERGRPKSLDNLNRESGVDFTLINYLRIHGALQFFLNKKGAGAAGPAVSLEFFFRTFKSGSRPFRNVLQYRDLKNNDIRENNSVKTFFQLIGLQIPETSVLKKLWGSWGKNGMCNRGREFQFKFFNNRLGLNARVCKFVNTVQAECSLCVSGNEPAPQPEESFIHTFYNCPYSEKYRSEIIRKFCPAIEILGSDGKKAFWFLGAVTVQNTEYYNAFVAACVFTVNFMIWQCKLQKNLMPVSTFFENFKYEVNNILTRSRFFREEKERPNNLSLF